MHPPSLKERPNKAEFSVFQCLCVPSCAWGCVWRLGIIGLCKRLPRLARRTDACLGSPLRRKVGTTEFVGKHFAHLRPGKPAEGGTSVVFSHAIHIDLTSRRHATLAILCYAAWKLRGVDKSAQYLWQLDLLSQLIIQVSVLYIGRHKIDPNIL